MGRFSTADSLLPPLPDELARICACKWDSDENKVVLEISEPDKKRTSDAEVCTWRDLFKDLEDEGHTDVTINSHDVQRVSMTDGADKDGSRGLSLISVRFMLEMRSVNQTPLAEAC